MGLRLCDMDQCMCLCVPLHAYKSSNESLRRNGCSGITIKVQKGHFSRRLLKLLKKQITLLRTYSERLKFLFELSVDHADVNKKSEIFFQNIQFFLKFKVRIKEKLQN